MTISTHFSPVRFGISPEQRMSNMTVSTSRLSVMSAEYLAALLKTTKGTTQYETVKDHLISKLQQVEPTSRFDDFSPKLTELERVWTHFEAAYPGNEPIPSDLFKAYQDAKARPGSLQ